MYKSIYCDEAVALCLFLGKVITILIRFNYVDDSAIYDAQYINNILQHKQHTVKQTALGDREGSIRRFFKAGPVIIDEAWQVFIFLPIMCKDE